MHTIAYLSLPNLSRYYFWDIPYATYAIKFVKRWTVRYLRWKPYYYFEKISPNTILMNDSHDITIFESFFMTQNRDLLQLPSFKHVCPSLSNKLQIV